MKNQHVIIADHPAKGEVNHCRRRRGGQVGAMVLPELIPNPPDQWLWVMLSAAKPRDC